MLAKFGLRINYTPSITNDTNIITLLGTRIIKKNMYI